MNNFDADFYYELGSLIIDSGHIDNLNNVRKLSAAKLELFCIFVGFWLVDSFENINGDIDLNRNM